MGCWSLPRAPMLAANSLAKGVAVRRGTLLLYALAATSLVAASPSTAKDLFTGTLLAPADSHRLMCIATNVGKKTKAVTAELIDSDTGVVVATQICDAVMPGTTCYVASEYTGINGHCRFSGKTQLRGAIWLQELAGDGAIDASLPASSR
jgi:hypothetical protein